MKTGLGWTYAAEFYCPNHIGKAQILCGSTDPDSGPYGDLSSLKGVFSSYKILGYGITY